MQYYEHFLCMMDSPILRYQCPAGAVVAKWLPDPTGSVAAAGITKESHSPHNGTSHISPGEFASGDSSSPMLICQAWCKGWGSGHGSHSSACPPPLGSSSPPPPSSGPSRLLCYPNRPYCWSTVRIYHLRWSTALTGMAPEWAILFGYHKCALHSMFTSGTAANNKAHRTGPATFPYYVYPVLP